MHMLPAQLYIFKMYVVICIFLCIVWITFYAQSYQVKVFCL